MIGDGKNPQKIYGNISGCRGNCDVRFYVLDVTDSDTVIYIQID